MDGRERSVLAERARALARPPARPPAEGAISVIIFALGGERYAIEAPYVIEVTRLSELALLPGAQPPAFGITAWRGRPLPILDVRPLLGASATELNDLGQMIVLGESGAAFGVLADAVSDLVVLRPSDVREPPEGVAVERNYLRGVTGDALLVLDAGKLLQAYA